MAESLLDCGGKRSATPLSHDRTVSPVRKVSACLKAVSRLPPCHRSPRPRGTFITSKFRAAVILKRFPPTVVPKNVMPKILLVEDNEMNRDMLSRRLLRKGYEVVMAVDGEQAVAMALSEAPALILMDMSLPVFDGWEATRRIKAVPAMKAIPIIALTAHAMAGDREKCVEAGCDDYDTKPIELPRLLEKMEALLNRKPAA